MRVNFFALATAMGLGLGVVTDAHAQQGEASGKPFFNPFSVVKPSAGPSWMDLFRSPSVTTGPRSARPSPGPAAGPPIDLPPNAMGPPPSRPPFRSPYVPPPRPPFGPPGPPFDPPGPPADPPGPPFDPPGRPF